MTVFATAARVGRTLCLLLLAVAVCGAAHAADFSFLFRHATVLDGSGADGFEADVAIEGDRIAAVGDLADASADREIDASGLILAPGFIDLHSHADGGGETGGLRSRDPSRRLAPNLVTQGVTTVVVNQDGRSLIDIGRQRRQLQDRGFTPNVILLVGHNTIRQVAMRGGSYRRPATADEIATMKRLLHEGMAAGAWGMSAGLEYEPGIWSTTDELVALVRELQRYNGVYIEHERASGSDPMWFIPSHDSGPTPPPTMLDSIRETIAIAERTGVTCVATHIKARGQDYWGKSKDIVEAIQAARERGVPIFADEYPYSTSGSDGTISLIPRWVLDEYDGDGSDYVAALLSVLADPARAQAMAKDIERIITRRGGAENIVILKHPNRSLIGKTLAEAARERGVSTIEMAYALQIEGYHDQFGGATIRGFSMNEEDVRRFAAQPWMATGSDAGIALPGDGLVHARFYGTFPRKIRRFALDGDLLTLPQAIRSMTGLTADILGLDDRGYLREGYVADLTVFDPEKIRDTSTFFRPHQYAEGIPYVMINGEFAVDEGMLTGAMPGRVLTRERDGSRHDTDD